MRFVCKPFYQLVSSDSHICLGWPWSEVMAGDQSFVATVTGHVIGQLTGHVTAW